MWCSQLVLHWGSEGQAGSEHTVGHHSFPAELQLYGYNSELYPNMSVAQERARGVVGIAVMLQPSDTKARHGNISPCRVEFTQYIKPTNNALSSFVELNSL